ncbi:1535_t:CDS:2 [Acaulospora colombiana]|uniref:1535_t:CDS:1 n=1 Tax=Acaulospora colombiana TaxID=27376 RepID=A0ACA9L226_9GLOM|nr:1535_t:CDS:2 [Acaulospora colombiana]
MTNWLKSYRRKKRREELIGKGDWVLSLVYSDGIPIPIRHGHVDLPPTCLNESPIGAPTTSRTEEQSLFRRMVSRVPSRNTVQEEKPEVEWKRPEIIFRHHSGNSPNYGHLKTPMGSQWEFEKVDVIAICYDRSDPKGLQHVIHKVCLYYHYER